MRHWWMSSPKIMSVLHLDGCGTHVERLCRFVTFHILSGNCLSRTSSLQVVILSRGQNTEMKKLLYGQLALLSLNEGDPGCGKESVYRCPQLPVEDVPYFGTGNRAARSLEACLPLAESIGKNEAVPS
jgi:hypothetical protein